LPSILRQLQKRYDLQARLLQVMIRVRPLAWLRRIPRSVRKQKGHP